MNKQNQKPIEYSKNLSDYTNKTDILNVINDIHKTNRVININFLMKSYQLSTQVVEGYEDAAVIAASTTQWISMDMTDGAKTIFQEFDKVMDTTQTNYQLPFTIIKDSKSENGYLVTIPYINRYSSTYCDVVGAKIYLNVIQQNAVLYLLGFIKIESNIVRNYLLQLRAKEKAQQEDEFLKSANE